jgi:Zn finger protein HypA/HybF involved in hydrogenase expression
MFLSHRHKQKLEKKTVRHKVEPLKCFCGSTEFLYGEKSALCKQCRAKLRKPRHGFIGPDGKRMTFTVYKCECGSLFSKKRGQQEIKCPKCGRTDAKVEKTLT